ncbi:MAG: nucleotidyl transferase AbiEii/AbiGii toxin family protein [Gammaproteobacteria bacterium]|nr:nucleotidyl transferase AbiEii/AbiGii toxin family protein [Gammaproteobacteria bacterium]
MGLIAPDLGEVADTADFYGIASGEFIIKDFYLTQVLHYLSTFKLDRFELIFCGGTCLSKGYQITQRMSEDVDFKLYLNSGNPSHSTLRKLCSQARKELVKGLVEFGFKVPEGEITALSDNQYACMKLFFQNSKNLAKNLRNHIKLELRYSALQHPCTYLQVSSLIDLAHQRKITKLVKCSILEATIAEKWVALTRRVIVEYEPTLLRHIYDIHMALASNKLNRGTVSEIIEQSIRYDAVQFKNQHTDYHKNPGAVIQRALSELQTNRRYPRDYERFLQGMIFGGRLPRYDTALENVLELSKGL